MRKSIFIAVLACLSFNWLSAQDHFIEASGLNFTPNELTINVGETVQWDNVAGFHNVNGSLATYPNNPDGFSSGPVAPAPWVFTYTFTVPGVYEYVCDQHAGLGMNGTITVVGSTLPIYDIGTINTVDGTTGVADSIDVECQIQGIVYGIDLRGGNGVQFTVRDATGGIGVFSTSLNDYTVQEGDEVTIQGTIVQFNGLTQISPDEIMLVSTGNTLETPDVVTVLDESTESDLVRINGVELVDPGQWPGDGSGFNITITDGNNNYTVRIDNDVELSSMPAPLGTFDIIGLGGQFDNQSPFLEGYQLLPRYAADIISTNANPFVGFATAFASVNEGDGTLEVPVFINSGNANMTSVDVIVSTASTAVQGQDFTFTTPTTVTFAGGVSEDTMMISVPITDDMEQEGLEQIVLAMINPTNSAEIVAGLEFYNVSLFDNDAVNINGLILTGVYDGTLTGGQPKGIEVYAATDIPDLSIYGLGSANNGGGSDGQEFTFPAVSASAGDYIYLTGDSLAFIEFFGFEPNYEDVDGAVNINGDDAVELYENGVIIDIFGEPDVSGIGEPWEYTDGWAYRVNGTGPDGMTFVIDNWIFSGPNGLEGGDDNATADVPMPIGTYQAAPPTETDAVDDNYSMDINTMLSFNVLDNDFVPGGNGITVSLSLPMNGMLTDFGSGDYTFTPDTDFCGIVSFEYEACTPGFVSCDTATVTIDVECPSVYPAYDIATVTTINGSGNPDSVGVSCQLQGVVHGIDLQGNDDVQFFLLDATGGISVFSDNDFGYTVQEGDEVIVQGVISEFSCLTQITPDGIQLVSTGNALNTANVINIPLSEDQESELIRINNLELVDASQWDNSNPTGFNVQVTDGTNNYLMRIDNEVDLYNEPAPMGAFDAIGLGGQFDNDGTCDGGYQFLPRYMADIIEVINTTVIDLSSLIHLAPNPATDQLNIQSDIELEELIVRDVLGQTIMQEEVISPQIQIANWNVGVYYISFKTEKGIWTTSFIKL